MFVCLHSFSVRLTPFVVHLHESWLLVGKHFISFCFVFNSFVLNLWWHVFNGINSPANGHIFFFSSTNCSCVDVSQYFQPSFVSPTQTDRKLSWISKRCRICKFCIDAEEEEKKKTDKHFSDPYTLKLEFTHSLCYPLIVDLLFAQILLLIHIHCPQQ